MDIPDIMKKKEDVAVEKKDDSVLFKILMGVSIVFIVFTLVMLPIIDGISTDKKAEKTLGILFGQDYYTYKEINEGLNNKYFYTTNSAIKTSVFVHLFTFIFLLVFFYKVVLEVIKLIKKIPLEWEHYTLAIFISLAFIIVGQWVFNSIMVGHITYPIIGFNRILEVL